MSSTRAPASDPQIELDPSNYPKARHFPWFTFVPGALCGAAYATHCYYRRHRPLQRRLRVTSMRLSEIYIVFGTMFSLGIDGLVMQHDMIYHDEDRLVIELGAYRMRQVLQYNDGESDVRQKVKEHIQELKKDLPCLTLRDDAYNAGSFWQKVVWWHDNLWADDATWVSAAIVMATGMNGMRMQDALLPTTNADDWVRCATHCANRLYEEEIGGYALYPFLFFAPIAMLARWTRRPVLYLPCNGLQRVLLWAYVYCGDWRTHRRLSSLQNIQETRKAALTMKHVLRHDFKPEIAHCRMWGAIIGPYNSVF